MHTHTLSAAPSAPRDNDVALRGVLEGMAVSGPTEEADAPEGSMMVPLLKHQRLALSWMKKRESGTISNQPVGGILADDQVLSSGALCSSSLFHSCDPYLRLRVRRVGLDC